MYIPLHPVGVGEWENHTFDTSQNFMLAGRCNHCVCSIVWAPSKARCDEHGSNSATWHPCSSSSRHARKNARKHMHEYHNHYYIIYVYAARCCSSAVRTFRPRNMRLMCCNVNIDMSRDSISCEIGNLLKNTIKNPKLCILSTVLLRHFITILTLQHVGLVYLV